MTPEHIRSVLDPEAMEPRLRAIPVFIEGAAELRAVSLERVAVKPGRGIVHTLYRITVDTPAGLVKTRAWGALLRPGETPEGVRRQALTVPERNAPGWCEPSWTVDQSTAVLESPPMLVQLFPWDYRLPTLSSALDPVRVQAGLPGAEIEAGVLAGYWPGVRCQVRYRRCDGQGTLYGKVFSRDGAGENVGRKLDAIARAMLLAGVTTVATPRVLAYLPALRLLVTGPTPGDPLPRILETGAGEAILPRVAAALATFHTLGVPEIESRFRPADDLEVVRPWIALVSAVFPSLGSALAAAFAGLERRLPDGEATRPALVHRDLYDMQVLVGPETIGLIDFDTACLGDPEIDIANFCAHLLLRDLNGSSATLASRSLRQGFLEAYRCVRPSTSTPLVTWYLASALLRLGCLFAMRPWACSLTPRLVELSREVLERDATHGL